MKKELDIWVLLMTNYNKLIFIYILIKYDSPWNQQYPKF